MDDTTPTIENRIENIVFGPEPERDEGGRFKAKAPPAEQPAERDEPEEQPEEHQEAGAEDGDALETESETEQEGDDNAPDTDAPSSMRDDERALFEQLTPEMKAFLARRESELSKGTQKVATQASKEREALEAERAKLAEAVQRITQAATQYRHPDILAHERDFGDYEAGKKDIRKLAVEDPLKFSEFQASRMKAANAWAEEQRASHLAQEQEGERRKQFRDSENARLREMVPELKSDKAWKAFDTEISDFLTREIGVKPEVVSSLGAEALMIARESMLYRRAKAKRAEAESQPSKTVPKVQKPGTAERRNPQMERYVDNRNKLKKSGKLEDAARIFEQFM